MFQAEVLKTDLENSAWVLLDFYFPFFIHIECSVCTGGSVFARCLLITSRTSPTNPTKDHAPSNPASG